jgi:hypothetical protein
MAGGAPFMAGGRGAEGIAALGATSSIGDAKYNP